MAITTSSSIKVNPVRIGRNIPMVPEEEDESEESVEGSTEPSETAGNRGHPSRWRRSGFGHAFWRAYDEAVLVRSIGWRSPTDLRQWPEGDHTALVRVLSRQGGGAGFQPDAAAESGWKA